MEGYPDKDRSERVRVRIPPRPPVKGTLQMVVDTS